MLFVVSFQTYYYQYTQRYHYSFPILIWAHSVSSLFSINTHFLFYSILLLLLLYLLNNNHFHSIDQTTNLVCQNHTLCVFFHSILSFWYEYPTNDSPIQIIIHSCLYFLNIQVQLSILHDFYWNVMLNLFVYQTHCFVVIISIFHFPITINQLTIHYFFSFVIISILLFH